MKTVLLLGAGRYNVPAIAAARRAGFRVAVADRDPNAPGLAVADVPVAVDPADVHGLTSAMKEMSDVDGVVSLSEVGVRAAAVLADRFDLVGIPVAAAERATSKVKMREAWRDLAPYTVDFRVVKSAAEARRAFLDLGRSVVVKPDRSFGGSRGVSRVDAIGDVDEAFAFAAASGLSDSAVIVETAVAGSEHSCEVLVRDRVATVLCIGEKVKTPFPYRVDLSVRYPAELPASGDRSVGEMCQQALTALGVAVGPAHVEFVYTNDGPVILEAGARPGGGHTPCIADHVSGVAELNEACSLACRLPSCANPRPRHLGADYRFLAFRPGRVVGVHGVERVLQRPGVLDAAVTVPLGTEIGPLRTTSDRHGFVVALAEDRGRAVALADAAAREITVSYDDGAEAVPALAV